jgi:X-X-X-Leu-X-X-Gly heptad repeat protein
MMATIGQRRRRRLRRQRSRGGLVSAAQSGARNSPARRVARRAGRRVRSRALMRPTGIAETRDGMEYVHCALGAMAGAGSPVGIPDKFAGKTIVIEHRSCVSFTVGASTNLYLACVPCPIMGLFVGSEATATGAAFSATVYDYTAAAWATKNFNTGTGTTIAGLYYISTDITSAAYMGLPYLEWQNGSPYSASGPTQNASFAAQAWRPVSSQMKVMFSGTSLSDSGVIAVARAMNEMTEIDWSHTQAGVVYYADTYAQTRQGITGGASFSTIASADGAVTLPVREGTFVVNVPLEDDREFIGFKTNSILASSNADTSTLLGQLSVTSTTPSTSMSPNPGVGGLTTTYVALSGVTSGQTIYVEQTNCIEYVISPATGTMARLARESPQHDPVAMETVAEVAKCLPAGVPVSEAASGSWWNRLGSIFSGAGKLAGNVGSLASGVGRLAIGAAPYIGAAMGYFGGPMGATVGGTIALGGRAAQRAIGY